MSCTWSGTITATGTLTPSGTTVSGGDATCSGSHLVNFDFSFDLCPSSTIDIVRENYIEFSGTPVCYDILTLSGHQFPLITHSGELNKSLYEHIRENFWELSLSLTKYSMRRATSFSTREVIMGGMTLNIFRNAAGFMGEHWECWGCPSERGEIIGGTTIYGFNADYWLPKSFFTWLIDRSDYRRFAFYGVRPASETYKVPVYNYNSPFLSNAAPPNGSFLVDPFLLPYDEKISLTLYSNSEYIQQTTGQLWVNHNKLGYIPTQIIDNFNFWSHDFRTQASGIWYGWQAMNAPNTTSFITNSGFNSCYILEGTTCTFSGIEPCEEEYRRGYTISGSPIKSNITNCDLLGTGYLEITPASGTRWDRTTTNAPFLYWSVPSGLSYWRIETGLSVYNDALTPSQRAGLLLTSSGNLNNFYFWGSDADYAASGVALYSRTSFSLPVASGLLSQPTPHLFHLSIEKLSGWLNFKYSQNGSNWTQIYTMPVQTFPPTLFQGLYAYHRFEETYSDFFDSSYNNRYGVRFGSLTLTSGVYGNAVQADNTANTYVNIYNLNAYLGAYTFAFWFKPTYDIGPTDSSWWYIIGGDISWGSSFAICMNRINCAGYENGNPGGGYLTFYTRGFGVCSTTRDWNKDTWYHIVAQFHASATSSNPYKLWVNGVQEQTNFKGSTGSTTIIDNVTNKMFYFWNTSSPTEGYARCHLDEVAHWTRELTPAEVITLYTSMFNREILDLSDNVYMGPCALNTASPSRIEAHYQYTKFVTSTGINIPSFIQSGDTWEQVVDKGVSITTPTSSVDTTITYPTFKTAQVYIDPKESFDYGETVAVRYIFETYESLKIPYTTDSGTLVCITADLQSGVSIKEAPRNTPIDISLYNHPIYSSVTSSGLPVVKTAYDELKFLQTCGSGIYYTDTNIVYQGTGSIYLTGNGSYISTEIFERPSGCFGVDDWTLHGWWRYDSISASGSLFSIYDSYSTTTPLLRFGVRYSTGTGWTGRRQSLAMTSAGTHTFGPITTSVSGWHHVAFTKNENWIYAFYDGERLPTGYFIGTTPLCTSSGIRLQVGGDTLTSYLDLVTLCKTSLWKYNFNKSEVRDSMYAFNVYKYSDLGVSFNITPDINPPVLFSVQPASGTVEVCPEEPIIFDVLDDYCGVDLNHLVIRIDGDCVWSGGINRSGVRGTLLYSEIGQEDGEWVSYGECNATTSGINRLLYPLGTAYSGSGAWGYRFNYTFFAGELPFGHQVYITASGLDKYGSTFQLDEIFSNFFDSSYDFTVKTNTELIVDNFFLSPGQQIFVKDAPILYADIYNTRYPVNDITESGCALRMYDGTNDITCSGYWFTTYTGIDSIVRHRLNYVPPTAFNYLDHKAMHWEFTAKSTYSGCDVTRTQEFIVYWGVRMYWPHKINSTQWPSFDPYKNITVFVRARTQTFLPADAFANCIFTTTPMRHSDLAVYFYAKETHKDLSVDIFAHNTYLLYNEEVEWTITAADYDGNILSFTGTFFTVAET